MRTTTYNPITGEADKVLTKAWAWRVSRRLELCAGWFHGPLPTLFYVQLCGRQHPGAVAVTLRAGRAMVGWRWYAAEKLEQAPVSGRCWNCEEWDPILNTGCGWCEVFNKETEAAHGRQCTAFMPMTPNTNPSGGGPRGNETTEAAARRPLE